MASHDSNGTRGGASRRTLPARRPPASYKDIADRLNLDPERHPPDPTREGIKGGTCPMAAHRSRLDEPVSLAALTLAAEEATMINHGTHRSDSADLLLYYQNEAAPEALRGIKAIGGRRKETVAVRYNGLQPVGAASRQVSGRNGWPVWAS